MRAVVLAAGRGTRMGALTENTPKPMIPINGKPVVEYVMRRMMAGGVTDFVLVTKYLAHKVVEYFGDGSALGAPVEYVEQTDKYGTGAALLAARELARNEPVMMVFADVIVETQVYARAIRIFKETNGAGVVTLNWVDDPCHGGAVIVDDQHRITGVIEKPPKGQIPSNWNSAGIFVFQPIVFDYLQRLSPSARGEYELPDAMNAMIADGLQLYPSYLEGQWLDVGTIEAVAVAEKMLAGEGE
ncbi:MAG: nucleotidyltransferase family protein [Armatimonadetes bacterium]|nr:nucleotidyltransferase family protein [Armatimonadota bacterium]